MIQRSLLAFLHSPSTLSTCTMVPVIARINTAFAHFPRRLISDRVCSPICCDDDVSGKGWAADERLDYKGMVYIYKGEEVFLEVLERARSFGDGITR